MIEIPNNEEKDNYKVSEFNPDIRFDETDTSNSKIICNDSIKEIIAKNLINSKEFPYVNKDYAIKFEDKDYYHSCYFHIIFSYCNESHRLIYNEFLKKIELLTNKNIKFQIIVAEENHNGNEATHFHIYLEFEKRFYFNPTQKMFDLKIKKKIYEAWVEKIHHSESSISKTVAYVIKECKILSTLMLQDIANRIKKNINKPIRIRKTPKQKEEEFTEQMISLALKYGVSYAMKIFCIKHPFGTHYAYENSLRAKKNLENWVLINQNNEEKAIYKVSEFDPGFVEMAERKILEQLNNPNTRKMLAFIGEPGIGKSQGIKSILDNRSLNYFIVKTDNDLGKQTPATQVILFDGYDFLKKWEISLNLIKNEPFNFKINSQKIIRVGNVCKIMIGNSLPKEFIDDNRFSSRLEVVNLKDPLYPTLIQINNINVINLDTSVKDEDNLNLF